MQKNNTLPANSMECLESATCLTFSFAINGLAPITNKYCDYSTTPACSVMDENCNTRCPISKLHKIMYRNLSFFSIHRMNSPANSRVFLCILWIYENMCLFDNSLMAPSKIKQSVAGLTIWTLKQIGRNVCSMYSIKSMVDLYSCCAVIACHIWPRLIRICIS